MRGGFALQSGTWQRLFPGSGESLRSLGSGEAAGVIEAAFPARPRPPGASSGLEQPARFVPKMFGVKSKDPSGGGFGMSFPVPHPPRSHPERFLHSPCHHTGPGFGSWGSPWERERPLCLPGSSLGLGSRKSSPMAKAVQPHPLFSHQSSDTNSSGAGSGGTRAGEGRSCGFGHLPLPPPRDCGLCKAQSEIRTVTNGLVLAGPQLESRPLHEKPARLRKRGAPPARGPPAPNTPTGTTAGFGTMGRPGHAGVRGGWDYPSRDPSFPAPEGLWCSRQRLEDPTRG